MPTDHHLDVVTEMINHERKTIGESRVDRRTHALMIISVGLDFITSTFSLLLNISM